MEPGFAPAYGPSFSRGPGGEHTLPVAGEGRRPGRVQIDQVAATAGIRPQRAGEIMAQVEAAVAGWDRHAQQIEVPLGFAQQIAKAMDMARNWQSVPRPPGHTAIRLDYHLAGDLDARLRTVRDLIADEACARR